MGTAHALARLVQRLTGTEGRKLAEGTVRALLAADGRLAAVTGFIDYVDPAVA